MKTPEEIINGHIKWMLGNLSTHGFRAGGLIRALDAAGYVIVPREPTIEMDEAPIRAKIKGVGSFTAREVWRAMIAAAQKDESPPSS